MSEANVVKFSNDGRLMLLTTADGHIHVVDSFRGTLVSCFHMQHWKIPFLEITSITLLMDSFLTCFCDECEFSYPHSMSSQF